MVVKETQRAFMYFCLYGLVVDAIVVNRLFPHFIGDDYFQDWIARSATEYGANPHHF